MKKTPGACWYGVYVGRKTGVFQTWTETEELTKGYPGAKFKKFADKDEAKAFATNGPDATAKTCAKSDKDALAKSEDKGIPEGVHVFTDGSYSSKTKRSGYGIAFSRPFQHLAVSKELTSGTTNQLAELVAIVAALTVIKKNQELRAGPVTIWTDSDYSIKCLTEFVFSQSIFQKKTNFSAFQVCQRLEIEQMAQKRQVCCKIQRIYRPWKRLACRTWCFS